MSSLPPIQKLTDHLGYWLRIVSNHVSQAFARKLEGQDVTVAEWAMLRTLYDRDSVPPSRLADEMGMTRGAITKLADRLINKELLVRTASDDDGRAQTLALSAQGVQFVPELAGLADQNELEAFAQLTPDDRYALKRILKTLADSRSLKSIPIN